MVSLLDIIPLSVLNKSYCSKNRSTSSTTVIIVIIVKYPKNFIYLLIITKPAKPYCTRPRCRGWKHYLESYSS